MSELTSMIAGILKDYSLESGSFDLSDIPLMKKIKTRIMNREEIVFVLPAFPAKSPSSAKTSGDMPDLGEVLALENLQKLCERLGKLHSENVTVAICSDGRVFSDVVKVSDKNIDRYNDGIKSIISEYNLDRLKVYSMEDFFPDRTPDELRKLLLDVYSLTLEEVKNQVIVNEAYKNLFCGVHKFLFEDEIHRNSAATRSSVSKETKARAYELIRRSDGWSKLLDEHFKDALRLSIHPYPLGHEKFGIKLLPGSSKWATPWHNVVVKVKNQFELMHKSEALKLNATLKMENNKYAYFEVSAV